MGGVGHEAALSQHGPWPVKSRLAASSRGRSHPQLRAAIERSRSREWLHRGRPRVRFCGVLAIRGCARGSYRLQKSTGGAWPIAPTSEELMDTMVGLATPRESVGAAKERRKPDRRWQSRETGGGLPPNMWGNRESGTPWEQPVEGRHSEPGKSSSLTRWRWKRFWLFAVTRVYRACGARQGVSEVVRKRLVRSTTPRRRRATEVALGPRIPKGSTGAASEWTEAGHASSSAGSARVGSS